jgi:hypothetical protein
MGFTEPDRRPPGQMPVSGFGIQAPYEAGSPDGITVGGDADAGGTDIVSATVAGAVASAAARYGELQGDTYGQGSHIGDLMDLPPAPPPWEGPYFPETNQNPSGGS